MKQVLELNKKINSCLLFLLIDKIYFYENNIGKKIFDYIFSTINEKNKKDFLRFKNYKWVITSNPNIVKNFTIENLFIINDKIDIIYKDLKAKHIELPKNIKIITSRIDTVTINIKNVEIFSTETFFNTNIKNISLNEKIKEIPTRAFSGSALEKINFKLNNNVIKISEFAFSSTYLKNIILPDNIIFIGKSAFSLNRYLEFLYLPEKLKYIFEDIVFKCVNLKTISVPKKFSSENYKNLFDRLIILSESNAKIIFREQ